MEKASNPRQQPVCPEEPVHFEAETILKPPLSPVAFTVGYSVVSTASATNTGHHPATCELSHEAAEYFLKAAEQGDKDGPLGREEWGFVYVLMA